MKRLITVAAVTAAFVVGIYAEPAKSEPNGKLQQYCSYTQSDDCIFIDSQGYWWDSEPSLNPVWIKMQKLSQKVIGSTEVVKLGNAFYCTKASMQIRESYLKCGANGWVFRN